jgi:hypothetical protein
MLLRHANLDDEPLKGLAGADFTAIATMSISRQTKVIA